MKGLAQFFWRRARGLIKLLTTRVNGGKFSSRAGSADAVDENGGSFALLDALHLIRIPCRRMYTGYYLSGQRIYGPRGYTDYWVSDHHLFYGRSGYIGFYISDGHFYGPHGHSGYYVNEGYIYGPEDRLPWSEDE